MRGGPRAAGAALAVLTACSVGGGEGAGPTTSGTVAPATGAPQSTTTTTTVAPTTTVGEIPGSVTLRITALTLSDIRSGGSGLRVVVRAASPLVRVRWRAGEGSVSACPASGASGPVDTGGCRRLAPSDVVDIAASAVELRAAGAGATVTEASLSYVPSDRTMTLVTPGHPAGACASQACQTTYSLGPAQPGSFILNGRPGGGRPRLVLSARAPAGGHERILATVEGGALFSIRATLEAGAEAVLLHHEQGPDPVAPVTADISWP